MGFVDDEGIVLVEFAVFSCFGKEDAVGHKFDDGLFAGLIFKTYLNAYLLSKFSMGFFGDALCHAGGGEAAGLGDADSFGAPETGLIDHFG